MRLMLKALLCALGANISFSTASFYYARFSEKYSAELVNSFKAFVAMFCFATAVFLMGKSWEIHESSYLLLSLSGLVGLFLGDIFLLKAMALLGASRTLMLFGFSPLVLGFSASLFFGQELNPWQFLAVLCLIGCLWSFALEKYKASGSWHLRGFVFALLGVLLDCAGLLLTRKSFDLSPEMSSFQANLIRSGVTVIGFALMSAIPFFSFSPLQKLKAIEKKTVFILALVSFVGTFVSLSFYLTAVRVGHLATVSAVAVTSPLFAAFFEIVTRQRPLNRYSLVGLIFFLLGFSILLATVHV
jgi:drug/metabolite transporter (DMT)-like permease